MAMNQTDARFRGSKEACRTRTVLTPQQARDIFKVKMSNDASHEGQRVPAANLAQKYSVNEKTVRDIWKGRTWYWETLDVDPTRVVDPGKLKSIGRPRRSKENFPQMREHGFIEQDFAPMVHRPLAQFSVSSIHFDFDNMMISASKLTVIDNWSRSLIPFGFKLQEVERFFRAIPPELSSLVQRAFNTMQLLSRTTSPEQEERTWVCGCSKSSSAECLLRLLLGIHKMCKEFFKFHSTPKRIIASTS
jgi:hypothetical protein